LVKDGKKRAALEKLTSFAVVIQGRMQKRITVFDERKVGTGLAEKHSIGIVVAWALTLHSNLIRTCQSGSLTFQVKVGRKLHKSEAMT